MATKSLPDQAYLRECFDYDPETGVIRWRQRPLNHFPSPAIHKTWTARFAGDIVGTNQGSGYRSTSVNNQKFLVHRLIWKLVHGTEPPEVDHDDTDRANNRIDNLRASDRDTNAQNCSVSKNNKLGLKGVYLARWCGRYRAKICVARKHICLGYHDTPEAAHAAYCEAAQRLHGEFWNPG